MGRGVMQTCPGCGATMRVEDGSDSLVCDYCKQVLVPEEDAEGVRVLGEVTTLDCPVCATHLVNASVARHRVLYCTHCHGTLIGMGEFVALVDDLRYERHRGNAPPHSPAAQELQRHIRCPQCHGQMDTHYYAGPGNIVIDDCSRCELDWLDAGELWNIARAPDHSYAPTSQSISDYS
jgi:Zn-finger nucleic acid-binding protein